MYVKYILVAMGLAGCETTFVESRRNFSHLQRSEIEVPKTKTLKGVTLKVAVLEDDRYKYDCVGGTPKKRTSYGAFVLYLLQEILRFEVRYVRVQGTTPVSDDLVLLTGGNLTDLILCHWTTTGRVPDTLGFLLPTLSTTESFVYQPKNLPLTQDVFVDTFSRKLWIFFLLSACLVVVFFWFSTRVHSRVRPDREPWSWDEVVLWAVAAVSQQSFSKHPRGSSCRTTFLIGYTVAYLLYTGFAAGITSLLALEGHRNQLNFENAAGMRLNLLYNLNEYFFNGSKNSGAIFAYDDFFRDAQPGDLPVIFSKIQKPNFVGIGSTLTLVTYLGDKVEHDRRESISVVPVLHSRRQKAILVRKYFQYQEVFNYWLLRLMECGLLHLGQKRLVYFGQTAGYPSTKWLSADLGNVFSAVLFLLGGYILSTLILMAEIIWARNFKPKPKPIKESKKGDKLFVK